MYKIQIDVDARRDIQSAIDWYNSKENGLGELFEAQLKSHISSLSTSPFYQKRYREIRCLPVRKFPYMIHYSINQEEKIVIIQAVFSTYINPLNWEKRQQ